MESPHPPPPGAEKPLPTTVVGRVRSRLPSRGWLIFLGVAGSLIAANRRDSYLTSRVHEQLIEKAERKANQPVSVTAVHPRYYVLLAPPPGHVNARKVRSMFREHVKPIFDAAALEYEVIEAASMDALRNEMRRRVHRAKVEGVEPALDSNGIRIPKALESGLIAVGRTSWRELLEGINEGCLSSPPAVSSDEKDSAESKDTVGIVEPRDDDEDIERKKKLASTSLKDMSTLELSETNLPNNLALPPVGFIPYRNLMGWRNFPYRFVSFFTDYVDARMMGEQALKVALEEYRPFRKGADESLGLAEDSGFESKGGGKLVSLAESVAGKLSVFDSGER